MKYGLLLLLSLATPVEALAQGCVDYTEYQQSVASLLIQGRPVDVAISGTTAYVADLDSGLQIVDIANPFEPETIGIMPDIALATEVAVSGTYAYVLDRGSWPWSDGRLIVVDVSDAETPRIVATKYPSTQRNATEREITCMDIAGSILVTAEFFEYKRWSEDGFIHYSLDGVGVLDISNPELPTWVGGLPNPGFRTNDIAVAGTIAYFATSQGLKIVDLTTPSLPEIVGEVWVPGGGNRITIAGSHAYVAAGSYGLHVFDITEPANPQHVGTAATPLFASGVVVHGASAYIASRAAISGQYGYFSGGDLQVFAVADPASPQYQGFYSHSGPGLGIADLTAPSTIPLLGEASMSGSATAVEMVGDHAFVASESSGLQAVDVSDPGGPAIVGGVLTAGTATDLVVSGSLAYVADGHAGLQIIEISDPGNLTVVGGADTPGDAKGVAVQGSYAYVADFALEMQVIDVSIPEVPTIVGTLAFPGLPIDVAVLGSHAFLVGNGLGLQVVDVSDPYNPVLVGSLAAGEDTDAIALSGTNALVVDKVGMKIVDISVPRAPQQIALVNGSFNGINIHGNLVYLTRDSAPGLMVVDIVDPSAPHVIAQVFDEKACGVAVSGECLALVGGTAYGIKTLPIQCGNNDLEVAIDIKPGNAQNPINCKGNPGVIPVAVLTTDTFDALTVDHTTVRFGPGEAVELHVTKGPAQRGNGEAIARQMVGVPKRHEEDVDDDGDIDLMFHFAREETGIRCGDTEAVLTGQTFDGQSIIGSDVIRTVPDSDIEPEPDAELQISPNPFNPSTRISFTVRTPEHVRVGVYDLRGQLMADLANEPYPVGRHALEWQGRDTAGRPVPSGMYFFRIDLGGQVEVRKSLLMK